MIAPACLRQMVHELWKGVWLKCRDHVAWIRLEVMLDSLTAWYFIKMGVVLRDVAVHALRAPWPFQPVLKVHKKKLDWVPKQTLILFLKHGKLCNYRLGVYSSIFKIICANNDGKLHLPLHACMFNLGVKTKMRSIKSFSCYSFASVLRKCGVDSK